MDFTIPYESEIDEKDKNIIDKCILNNIKEYGHNSAKLTELTIEAVSSLSAGMSRTEFLAKQGFLKNIFNSKSKVINNRYDLLNLENPDFSLVNKKVIVASSEELENNLRAKSAKLRAIERIK